MFKDIKIIKFMPTNDFVKNVITGPIPASKNLPSWYSKMNLFADKTKTYGLAENIRTPNTTVKACSPFLDALTTGYIYYLPADLEVTKSYDGTAHYFRWRADGDFISPHSKQQHPDLPSAFNGSDEVFKFTFDFTIKTPKGYSTLFTHPFNRHDLPFRTFTGVVDTDKYKIPIQFPFQMLEFKEERIIIPKATPVCQFFSFKRNKWVSINEKFKSKKHQKDRFKFFSTIKRSYRDNYWTPKEYK